jgi:hypothetical protein
MSKQIKAELIIVTNNIHFSYNILTKSVKDDVSISNKYEKAVSKYYVFRNKYKIKKVLEKIL